MYKAIPMHGVSCLSDFDGDDDLYKSSSPRMMIYELISIHKPSMCNLGKEVISLGIKGRSRMRKKDLGLPF